MHHKHALLLPYYSYQNISKFAELKSAPKHINAPFFPSTHFPPIHWVRSATNFRLFPRNIVSNIISETTTLLIREKATKAYLPGGPPAVQALWTTSQSKNFLVIAIDIKRHNVAKGSLAAVQVKIRRQFYAKKFTLSLSHLLWPKLEDMLRFLAC